MAGNDPKSGILIKGARAHNLKNINVFLPHNSLTVITGVSGSGKSSLAFDTLYAEGQRRYVESLSTYARQFLGQMDKADVDSIEGLSPAIAIEQRTTQRNPRSTVGTVTEIHDHLRLFWARVGTPHCPKCGREVVAMPPERITDAIVASAEGAKVMILSPVASGKKGTFRKELADLKRQGFTRFKIDAEIVRAEDVEELKKTFRHDIDVIVDRLVANFENRSRIVDAIEIASKVGNGLVAVETEGGGAGNRAIYSELAACPDCGIGIEPLDPKHFSFNSPHGACADCAGLGVHFEVDPEKVVGDPDLSIKEGVLLPWGENPQEKWYGKVLARMAVEEKFDIGAPWKSLPRKIRDVIVQGGGAPREYEISWKSQRIQAKVRTKFECVVENLARRYKETTSSYIREWIEGFMSMRTCSSCKGERLKATSRAVRVAGERLPDLLERTVDEVDGWLTGLSLDKTRARIAERVIAELHARLGFLKEVGLGYLTLERNAATLSGGEAQRIRLATQLGSRLRGVLYVLDEPSIGLHPADTEALLKTLKDLRDLGNTVIVVEHDRETIEAADHIIDMGPGAGRHGGEITAEGTPQEIEASKFSLTGAYLSGRRSIEHNETPRTARGELTITGVRTNNLKKVTAAVPLGQLVCVTGVSGSGKSSLIMDTLVPAVLRKLGMNSELPGPFDSLKGIENIEKLISIDQSPIGRTSRSNPATYTGVFTMVRDIYAMTRDARERGYKPGRFSFNVKGGRCEECQGDGTKTVEMHFLPDVYVPCEACNGRRYNRETLEVKYKGKSIADVLEMTIEEAREFFAPVPGIKKWLEMLFEVGLGYLQLGQSAPTLSGGEAQRLKLASELGKSSKGRTLYVLDEPTTGLHLEDVRVLIRVLDRLVDRGDTVLVVEHHPDVMAHSDTLIDLGPGSGALGGEIVKIGSPREVADEPRSLTGKTLKAMLGATTIPSTKKGTK
jgi:excinuclease ABC subunit A